MVSPRWQIVSRTSPNSEQEVVDILLENRGVGSSFLNCTLADLEAHLCILGMDEGAELMAWHLCAGHKIVLVADYDCDGVTSAAQMCLFLREIGYHNYRVIIPARSEGYGFPERAVLDNTDARLFVVMDCGTIDFKSISMVRDQGSDCIVIDHHEVPSKGCAPATILINPKQPSCPSRFKEMSSSGLTLLFLTRLRRALQGRCPPVNLGGKYLVLASLGTITDIVPLVEANRILTRSGLTCMNSKSYPPVQSIINTMHISTKTLTAGHVGFFVGPRINAAGRVADPHVALELLISQHPEEMDRLAQQLDRLNAKRKHQEEVILREVSQRFTEQHAQNRTVVMGDPTWHPGIIGIIASRIQQDIHYGPTAIFSIDESTGICRGSVRSITGFDIHSVLGLCNDLLIKWGGHKMAAGLSISLDKMQAFAERFEGIARESSPEIFFPREKVDMQLDLGLVSPRLLTLLKQLEPHGQGNPAPTFAARQIRTTIIKAFGRDQNHLRLSFGNHIEGVFWKGMHSFRSGRWKESEFPDVVFQLQWDDYHGKPVLNVKDLAHSLWDPV